MFYNICRCRDVAQLDSALPWGGRGREFKSHRSDQITKFFSLRWEVFLYFLVKNEKAPLLHI